MKNLMTLCVIAASICLCKSQPQYRVCTGCGTTDGNNDPINGTYTYDQPVVFSANQVASDYGARDVGADHYDWHSGIDYGAGANDRGYLLLALEGGSVRLSAGNAFKYIIIDSPNHDFGYAHIFRSAVIGPTDELISGACVIKRMLSDPEQFALIVPILDAQGNVTGHSAIGEFAGTVEFNGQVYSIDADVEAGDIIAPLGDSNTANVDPHLHLYCFANNNFNTSDASADNNSALEYVNHVAPQYNIQILQENDITAGIELVYPGSLTSTIQVRPRIANENINASGNYNSVYNVNTVRVLIKKESEPASAFTTIQGPYKESELSLGGTNATQLHNLSLTTIGSWTSTGVEPHVFADNNGHPWDDFYYADFATRIHMNDTYTGTNLYASCPEEARYPDGIYNIKAEVTNVLGNIQEGPKVNNVLTPVNITIDNFKPYIQRVTMESNNQTIYDSQWDCEACGGIAYHNTTSETVNLSQLQPGLTVTAYSSEPLSSLSLAIPYLGYPNTIMTATNSGTTFVFQVPVTSSQGVDRKLQFSGADLGLNMLMDLSDFTGAACVQVPTRTSATAWSNPNNITFGIDDTHQIPVLCPVITPVAVVTTPSSCIINDGFIHLLQINGEGSQGTDIEWWDMQTSTELVPIYGSISNLAPGIYRLSITDLESGCISQTFYDLNTPSTQINTDVYSSPTCVGASVGAIEVDAYTLDYSGGSYDFAWSNGEITTDAIISEINGLAAGIYTVTVSSPETGCTTMTSVEVVAIAPSAPLSVTGTSLNACPGLANGIVTLQVTGGISPYAYHWSSTSYGSHPNNLAPGTHTVTVTDYCGTSVVKTFSITTMNFDIVSDPGCSDLGILNIVSLAGGNSPYTALWDTGESGLSISHLSTGNYKATVTDATGCPMTKNEWLINKEYFAEETLLPCDGMTNGVVTLHINNPEYENVEVLLFSTNIPVEQSFQPDVLINNLTANTLYEVTINIGNECTYTHPFSLEGVPLTNDLNHFDEDEFKCYYDQSCNGVLTGQNTYAASPAYDLDGISFCKIPVYCGQQFIYNKAFGLKKVSYAEYLSVLNYMEQNLVFSPDYIQSLRYWSFTFGLTLCDPLWYCPATLQMIGDLSFLSFPVSGNAINLGNGCWEVPCIFIPNPVFCENEMLPDYAGIPQTNSTFDCDLRQYRVYQLIKWYDDLSLISGFVNGTNGNGSSLKSFLESIMSGSEEDQQKAMCANVTFCKSDYSIISSDIGTVDCSSLPGGCINGGLNFPPSPTCVITDTYPFGEAVRCKRLDENGCWVPDSYIAYNEFDPATFLQVPNNDGTIEVIVPEYLSSTYFKNFSYKQINDVIVPNGLLGSENGPVYYDFAVNSHTMHTRRNADWLYYYDDWNNNTETIIEANGPTSFILHFISTSGEILKEIESDNLLQIIHLSKEGSKIFIGGTFKGNLTYDSDVLASSVATAPSDFIIVFDEYGSNLDIHVIGKTDAASEMKFEVKDDQIIATDKGKTNSITVDGENIILGETGKTFSIKFDENTTIESIIKSTGTVKLLDMARSADGQRITYLYKGQGSVKVNNTTVVTTTVDRLILLTTSADDQYLWVRTIDSPLPNDAPAGLTYGDDYQVYTGLTHNSGISISGNPIDNNGGYDIFLLRFDENGDLTGNKVYGTSQEDENVKQLFYNSGILYFGGEFMGPTEERIIGKYRFLNLAGNNSNAYISFVKMNHSMTRLYSR